MLRWLTAATTTAALLALGCATAFATPTPASGTLSPATPLLTYGDGPFTGANPSNDIPGSVGPNCSLVPNSCSDYMLTVAIPAGYTALHPNDVVTIKVSWPDATVNDFDIYILDASGTTQAYPGAGTSSDPEIASFHVIDGTATYLIRVAAFQTANESYTATVAMGPPSSKTPVLAHSYSIGTDVWSCNTHLAGTNPSGPPPALDQSLDGEPLTAFDKNGRLYVAALNGVGGGCGAWYSDDACGQAYTFIGTPDDGAGGGDAEIRTAPEKNVLGFYNVYYSSLSLANITVAASFDGGNTFTASPISVTPVDDRNWQCSYGPSTCYLSYVNGALQPGNFMEVVRLDYSGLAAPVVSPASIVWDPAHVDPNLSHQKGNIVADQRPGGNATLLQAGPNGEGNVYCCWTESGQRVFVSVSTDFGTTWTHHLIWDGGIGSNYSHIFTWMAVDNAGNLYNTFSDDRNVYLCTSTDHGVTWTTPVRVNRGGASTACIFPQIAAGSPGRIVMDFYGTDATTPHEPSAEWSVFVARSQNALLQQPDFEEVKVNDKPFHSGAVCEDGLNCSSGRELSDNFDIDINPVDGSAGLAYGVFAVSGSFIARQVSGTSAYADKTIVDRSTSCPTPANNCMAPPLTGSPCIGPGYVTVVTDVIGSADTPPTAMPSEDILAVGVGEPASAPNSLVFSIKVASLDPQNLPADVFWRAIWDGPGGKRYVDVINCATSGLSSHYGHFTTGSVEDGPSDGFTVTPDGYITVTIAKSKVDNPQPGQTLAGVNADCRTIAGSCPVTGSAAFAPNDVTNSGQYLVVGNDWCTPLSVACPGNLVARPGDYTLDFNVTNPSIGTHPITGTVTDANGWISPISVLAGPLAAGATGTLSATVHVPGDCAPAADDPLTFHVASPDLPNAAECNTVVHCGTTTTGVDNTTPRQLALAVAGANPFRVNTLLSYALPHTANVKIEVFSIAGRRLRTLVNGQQAAGRYTVPFDLRAEGSTPLGPGMYYVALTANGEKRTVTLAALQ